MVSPVGAALERTGQQVTQGANDWLQYLTDKARMDSQLTAVDEGNKITEGMDSELNEFQKLRGQDPQTQFKPFMDKIQQMRDKGMASMPNEYARIQLGQRMGFVVSQMQRMAAGHAAEQYNVWMKNASEGESDLYTAQAAKETDPDKQAELIEKSAQAAQRYYINGLGLGGDALAGRLADHIGESWAPIITGMAESNPTGAWALFNQHKDEMNARWRAAIQEHIEPKLNAGQNQAAGDDAIARVQARHAAEAAGQGAAKPAQPFVDGQMYQDANGHKAIYQGGQWIPQ